MAKNVSNQFKNIIKNGGPFYAYAAVTFADGSQTIMNSKTDFMATGNGYSESSEAGFPLGVAISKTITLNIDNTTAYESIQDTEGRHIQDTTGEDILANKKSVEEDYYNARIVLYTEADLPDGTQERVQEGIFTVIDSVRPDEVLEITAYDDMYKADVAFYSSLTYPVSVQMLLNEVCNFCDITLGSATFKNNDYQIHQAPQNLTARQVIGYIAQIAGGNAVIDRNGRLVIKSYDLSGFDASEEISSDEIESESGIHIFSRFTSAPDIGVADVIITGVSTEVEDENGEDEVYLVGTEEYAISVDNPLITGNEQDAVNRIAESIMGLRMRPFSGNFLPDPTVEFMDLCYVIDRKDNIYKSFVTLHDFDYLGGSMFANETESPQKFGGTYYSEAAQAYQKAKEDIKNNKKQWEQAIENLSQQVANASGLYTTEEEQPDGSTIFYMHNKPTLEESDIVWQMTAETLTVSTDGGKTWNAGITVNGEVIARIMNTIGINFDWGVGGTLIVQDEDGNQTAYIDAETGTVRFAVESLTITGKTVQEIASEQSETAINDFVDAVYNPDITNLQAQIDGQIETWFYNYVPTTSNAPASNWTTDSEKERHLGDLFYVVDNEEYGGQAYRWAKINNAYTWDYVEDTAVTKALADAAAAQDTADQKRRVFVTQPVPPYDIGDLWVGNTSSDLMRCQTSRQSGNYNAADWIKAVKYTDNSDLYVFIEGDYQETINELKNQVDQKTETWYQPTDPSLEWDETEETALQDTSGENILDNSGDTIITIWEKSKYIHEGDLWKNSDTNIEYIYQNGQWVEMPIPDSVFDEIDGKAQIFITTPAPPYSVGDLWFNSSTSDIMTCVTSRASGSYTASDWQKRNKYTDDSYAEQVQENLSSFSELVTGEMNNMQVQIDGKIETYYYDYQPTLTNIPASEWTTNEERTKHVGDLFYWQSKGFTYRFTPDGNTFKWQAIQDSDINTALANAAAAQDTADGKRRVFYTTPSPPYDVGDLWSQGSDGDIMICKTPRASGSYVSSDWVKASKYTDDSAVEDLDHSLDKQGVFDRLTNYGEVKGIFLKSDGQLYINASYLMAGILKVAQPGASGKETFYANMETGEVRIVANSFSLTNGDTIDSIAQGAVDDLDTSLDQQEVFNRLTNNGKAHGITLHKNGQLYINAEYIQSLILKVGGANNENGTFEVYNGSGVLVGKIDKDGAKFTNGNDWLQIQNSLMTGGYGGTTDGLLDLSANYSGGERHVVLESKTGDVILKSSGDFLVERTGTGQGTLLQSGNYQYLTDVGDVEITSSETEELRAIALGESVSRDASNNPIDALALIRKDTLSKVFYEGDYFSYFSSHIITGWRFVSLTTPTTIAPGYSWDLTANAAGSGIPTRTGTEYLVIPISTGWGAVGSIDQPSSGNTNFTVSVLNNGSSAHTIGCTCLVLGLLSRDLSPLA